MPLVVQRSRVWGVFMVKIVILLVILLVLEIVRRLLPQIMVKAAAAGALKGLETQPSANSRTGSSSPVLANHPGGMRPPFRNACSR